MSSLIPKNLPEGDEPVVHQGIPINGKSVNEGWEEYKIQYNESINNSDEYWRKQAMKHITWFSPFTNISSGNFIDHDVNWFANGKLNVCYNCVDRHLPTKGDQPAILWEGDEVGTTRTITYNELVKEVSKISNVMKKMGVRKGDVVTIYMPMIPELAMVMLACTRIGAIHSIVFAGFSSESLRGRITDCNSTFVFVADEGLRGGKTLKLKSIADEAIEKCPDIKTVFVFKRTGANVAMGPKDVWMEDLLPTVRPFCPCESMDSEDSMFILYTSGSTGKPKGVAHTTAGYLLNAAITTSGSFNVLENDVFCCAADCGWITGHTYIVYGPLCLGSTTVMFESVPTYPNAYRYWDVVQRYKITQFYTAPTAIRTLMRFEAAPIAEYDLSTLRVLGSVGEPINPAAWDWYNVNIGRGKCSVSDTYWQTETGAHIATNMPGAMHAKPGSCALPYYGIQFAVLDPTSGVELEGNNVEGVLCIKKPWPSIARTVYGDHDRFLSVYTRPYPGYYFTGDGCKRDNDGYYWITGRVDDVINPSGHRLGTAEVESALVACEAVSEAAVIGFPHEVKGEGIGCYIILKNGFEGSSHLITELKLAVRAAIGPIATPDFIIFSDLPKTRSGKIMRRILRKIAAGEEDSIGDVSTLADPTVVDALLQKFKALSSN
jgi:acetyl-CoA synthetase